jgi:hypothetical protein
MSPPYFIAVKYWLGNKIQEEEVKFLRYTKDLQYYTTLQLKNTEETKHVFDK